MAHRKRARIRERPVTSVTTGKNAALIREVCRLYAPSGTTIADVTFGRGNFWPRPTPDYVTGSDLITAPDGRAYDFRDLPYANGSFDIVVLDPPYIMDGQTTMARETYQTQLVAGLDDLLALYRAGMAEAHRVARRQLWVKCQDQVHSGVQHWVSGEVVLMAREMGLHLRDTFVLVQSGSTPSGRWSAQHHARKRHSFLMVFDVTG